MLGLAVGDTLEVTQCFPIASINPDDEIPEDEQVARARDDTITMMTLLRTVNVDSNSVRTSLNANVGQFGLRLLECLPNCFLPTPFTLFSAWSHICKPFRPFIGSSPPYEPCVDQELDRKWRLIDMSVLDYNCGVHPQIAHFWRRLTLVCSI